MKCCQSLSSWRCGPVWARRLAGVTVCHNANYSCLAQRATSGHMSKLPAICSSGHMSSFSAIGSLAGASADGHMMCHPRIDMQDGIYKCAGCGAPLYKYVNSQD